jgi:hypothetical protein
MCGHQHNEEQCAEAQPSGITDRLDRLRCNGSTELALLDDPECLVLRATQRGIDSNGHLGRRVKDGGFEWTSDFTTAVDVGDNSNDSILECHRSEVMKITAHAQMATLPASYVQLTDGAQRGDTLRCGDTHLRSGLARGQESELNDSVST